MRTVFIFTFLLIVKLSVAQNPKRISGHLMYKNGQIASNVTVSLLRSTDSALVKRVYTLEDGQYIFERVSPDVYFLAFTSLGTLQLNHGPITLEKADVTLPLIYLDQNVEQLKEVNINAGPPLIQKTMDKTIINVEHTSLAVGNTALDILNRAPGVTVLNDGTIQLNGKQGVTVMLDGKLTYLSSAQLTNMLQATNSSQIRSIEIMTHPPVKYDASGSAGLININLKKNKEFGRNGIATTDNSMGRYLKSNTGLSINQRSKRLNIYGNYNYADNKRYGKLDLDRNIVGLGNFGMVTQQSSSTTINHNHTYKAGLEYDIAKNNTLGFVMAGYLNDQAELINSNSFIKEDKAVQPAVSAFNTGKNRYSNRSYNLNYKSILDTLGQQIDADFAILDYDNAEQVLYENSILNDTGDSFNRATVFRNISPTELKIRAVTLNYTIPVSKSLAVDLGFKSSIVKTDNDFLVENKTEGFWIVDSLQSNHFKYKEVINAAYLSLNKDLANFHVKLGIRVEHTSTEGNSITLSNLASRKYLDIFPVISLSKKIDKHNTLGLNANRRIDRPNYGSLNPFKYFLDLYTYKSGNPDLKPQYTNSLSLNYLLSQKYSLELAYSQTKDLIADIIQPDTIMLALYTSPENMARQNSISLSLNVPLRISRFWNLYNDLNVYRINFYSDNVAGAVYKSDQNAMNFKSSSTFTLSNSVHFDLAFNYQSKQHYGTSYLKPISFFDAGTSYQFFQDRLNVKLSVKDIFNQKTQILYSNLPGIQYKMIDKPETRLFAIGLSYSFGAKEVKSARIRSGGIEQERGRIGGVR